MELFLSTCNALVEKICVRVVIQPDQFLGLLMVQMEHIMACKDENGDDNNDDDDNDDHDDDHGDGDDNDLLS